MRFTRIFTLSAAALLCGAVTAPAHAFMAAEAEIVAAEGSLDLGQLVTELNDFVASEENTCEQKLIRVNEAIVAVEKLLDAGTNNEADVLSVRDQLLEIRRELKCSDELLAHEPMGDLVGPPMDGGFIDGGFIDGGFADGGFVDGGFGGGGHHIGGGHHFGGGGGGGGGGLGGGGGGFGLLAAGGIAAAIAIPLSTNDDNPGTPASPSGQ
ncbi:hypothetical protein SH528x_002910 [Novipirellula sp. SH528]|uniref:hypothetical protein n=1 Tax=Novipirellula sp. SH528 TaxID=3454466 RepID=UPI003FA073E1